MNEIKRVGDLEWLIDDEWRVRVQLDNVTRKYSDDFAALERSQPQLGELIKMRLPTKVV